MKWSNAQNDEASANAGPHNNVGLETWCEKMQVHLSPYVVHVHVPIMSRLQNRSQAERRTAHVDQLQFIINFMTGFHVVASPGVNSFWWALISDEYFDRVNGVETLSCRQPAGSEES